MRHMKKIGGDKRPSPKQISSPGLVSTDFQALVMPNHASGPQFQASHLYLYNSLPCEPKLATAILLTITNGTDFGQLHQQQRNQRWWTHVMQHVNVQYVQGYRIRNRHQRHRLTWVKNDGNHTPDLAPATSTVWILGEDVWGLQAVKPHRVSPLFKRKEPPLNGVPWLQPPQSLHDLPGCRGAHYFQHPFPHTR